MKKETCKQCIAGLGLIWEYRKDLRGMNLVVNTEDRWQLGRIRCPRIYTDSEPLKTSAIDKPPPPWCPHGFENRVRELEYENV